jgi:hypothetical protein
MRLLPLIVSAVVPVLGAVQPATAQEDAGGTSGAATGASSQGAEAAEASARIVLALEGVALQIDSVTIELRMDADEAARLIEALEARRAPDDGTGDQGGGAADGRD